MSMTQAQFFTAVADKAGISKAQAKAVFAAVEEVVMKSLKSAGKIPLGGLGAVKLQNRKARMGRNPATGEAIKIAAKTVVKIAPAKALKDAFNKKSKQPGRRRIPRARRTRSDGPSRISGCSAAARIFLDNPRPDP
jgi:DNA-binding protein HU-beta